MNEAGFGELLDLVYGSIVEPDLWVNVIERIADGTGGQLGWLSQLNVRNGSGSGVLARVDPAIVPAYFEHFAPRNPFVKFSRLHNPSVPWTPKVMVDDEQLPRDMLIKTEYYNDHMAAQQANHVLLIDLAVEGLDVVTVNIGRSEKHGRFTGEDIRVAEALLPHLIRAYKLSGIFSGVGDLSDLHSASVYLSDQGVFIVDPHGRLKEVNQTGETMIGRRDCLRLVGGRLVALTTDASKTLQALIARAASTDPGVRTGGSMALPSSAGRPLSLKVVPLKQAPVFTNVASVLVTVTDLGCEQTVSGQRLREFFGLTAAEARIATALFEGATPKQIAQKNGVSINTIRAQLASIYDKTGTTGQSELARLMTREAFNSR